ncbi:MAG: type IV toxin-antitoxin system AbiEi family antitoxin domain-containing protein [Planctomycetes bacterium]|nr:type IV toxin-antitoxin system AbiEi family antitoxin domain-containing protein [Planctomycetota bacterium]
MSTKKKGGDPVNRSLRNAVRVFKDHGGVLRTVDVLRAGVHQRTLYAMREAGIVARLGRGLYRLADNPPLANPDLVVVAAKAPKGVVCLISALAFHNLTTQIPHEVYLAVQRGSEFPRIEHPPVRIIQMSPAAFREGIETHDIDNIRVRVYSPEKTLADCFKFRNKIGLDTAVEALRFYRERRKVKVGDLLRYAAVCRVAKVMRPYLETLL